MPDEPLLSVEGLGVRLHGTNQATRTRGGTEILADVNLTVRDREIVGLIGETGSGKTTLARAITGLVAPSKGAIRFRGEVISGRPERAKRAFRRRGEMQFIFQDPLRSLDPDMTIQQIVTEGLAIQGKLDTEAQWYAAQDALRAVGLDPSIGRRRPGQVSGGQRQRVAIARAVVMGPKLLLCDEPVSALDASTRNFVLGILAQLRNNSEIALLIISHDLASLAGVADRIAVLYRGRIVEQGTVEKLFSTPRHPYTALLLSSAPSLARDREVADIAPSMIARPSIPLAAGSKGCVFADRCMFASDICLSDTPQELEVEPGWSVACHNASKWRSEVGPHAFVQ